MLVVGSMAVTQMVNVYFNQHRINVSVEEHLAKLDTGLSNIQKSSVKLEVRLDKLERDQA